MANTMDEKKMMELAAAKLGISPALLAKLKSLNGNPELTAKLEASVTAIEGDAAAANFRFAFKSIKDDLIKAIKAIGKPTLCRFTVVETTSADGVITADLSVEIVDKEKRAAANATGGKKGKKSDSELAECKRLCANALRDKPGNINNACKAGGTTALTLKKYIAAETDENGFVAKYADKPTVA